jgi:hypothetical protein
MCAGEDMEVRAVSILTVVSVSGIGALAIGSIHAGACVRDTNTRTVILWGCQCRLVVLLENKSERTHRAWIDRECTEGDERVLIGLIGVRIPVVIRCLCDIWSIISILKKSVRKTRMW